VLDRYRILFGLRWFQELAAARGLPVPFAGECSNKRKHTDISHSAHAPPQVKVTR
jgi:hypothetical protein